MLFSRLKDGFVGLWLEGEMTVSVYEARERVCDTDKRSGRSLGCSKDSKPTVIPEVVIDKAGAEGGVETVEMV